MGIFIKDKYKAEKKFYMIYWGNVHRIVIILKWKIPQGRCGQDGSAGRLSAHLLPEAYPNHSYLQSNCWLGQPEDKMKRFPQLE